MEGNRRFLSLCALPVSELARGLENGTFSSEDVTQAFLDHIALQNPALNVFLEVFEASAREEARGVRSAAAGRASPFPGWTAFLLR